MYKLPIEIIHGMKFDDSIEREIATALAKSTDEYIYQSICNVGVNVDKDELIKALQYDRQQYKKGYADAVEKVATILAEMLDTPCNFSPTDEWLPYVCDYKYSCDCEYKECWKQLFKHWDERKCEDG